MLTLQLLLIQTEDALQKLLLSPALEAAVIAAGVASDSSGFPSSPAFHSARDGAEAAPASAEGPGSMDTHLSWAVGIYIWQHFKNA